MLEITRFAVPAKIRELEEIANGSMLEFATKDGVCNMPLSMMESILSSQRYFFVYNDGDLRDNYHYLSKMIGIPVEAQIWQTSMNGPKNVATEYQEQINKAMEEDADDSLALEHQNYLINFSHTDLATGEHMPANTIYMGKLNVEDIIPFTNTFADGYIVLLRDANGFPINASYILDSLQYHFDKSARAWEFADAIPKLNANKLGIEATALPIHFDTPEKGINYRGIRLLIKEFADLGKIKGD